MASITNGSGVDEKAAGVDLQHWKTETVGSAAKYIYVFLTNSTVLISKVKSELS